MILKHFMLIPSLYEHWLILLYTVKWFQVFLCITMNPFKNKLLVCIQQNDQTVLFLKIQVKIINKIK